MGFFQFNPIGAVKRGQALALFHRLARFLVQNNSRAVIEGLFHMRSAGAKQNRRFSHFTRVESG